MTTQEIQNGWSSTVSADIWFWNSYNNTTTLKQTITGSNGSSTVQQRVIQDTGCNGINCGQFTNYTDTHIQGSNTQTVFDIKVGVSNSNNRTGHWGPDIDDVQLKVVYTYINPLDETTEESIELIDETIDESLDTLNEEEWFYEYEEEYIDWEYTYEEENTREANY